jgi:hypothetical protein
MKREELIERLRSLKPLLAESGVIHVSLFGSRARNDHHDDSDLDLLIEVDPGRKFSLVELARAQAGVSREIGIPASLALKRSLDQRFAAEIASDVIDVF